jgi:hypothetical protein
MRAKHALEVAATEDQQPVQAPGADVRTKRAA